MSIFERERTCAEVIMYALYLYFLGLSFRGTPEVIQPIGEEGKGVMLQYGNGLRFSPKRLYSCKRVSAYLLF